MHGHFTEEVYAYARTHKHIQGWELIASRMTAQAVWNIIRGARSTREAIARAAGYIAARTRATPPPEGESTHAGG
jgi:hypothetical protein